MIKTWDFFCGGRGGRGGGGGVDEILLDTVADVMYHLALYACIPDHMK